MQELVISPDHDSGENLKTSIDQQNIEINLNNKDSELCGDINFLIKKCSRPQFKMQDIRDRILTYMQDEESKGSTDGSEDLDVMQIKLTNAKETIDVLAKENLDLRKYVHLLINTLCDMTDKATHKEATNIINIALEQQCKCLEDNIDKLTFINEELRTTLQVKDDRSDENITLKKMLSELNMKLGSQVCVQ